MTKLTLINEDPVQYLAINIDNVASLNEHPLLKGEEFTVETKSTPVTKQVRSFHSDSMNEATIASSKTYETSYMTTVITLS